MNKDGRGGDSLAYVPLFSVKHREPLYLLRVFQTRGDAFAPEAVRAAASPNTGQTYLSVEGDGRQLRAASQFIAGKRRL